MRERGESGSNPRLKAVRDVIRLHTSAVERLEAMYPPRTGLRRLLPQRPQNPSSEQLAELHAIHELHFGMIIDRVQEEPSNSGYGETAAALLHGTARLMIEMPAGDLLKARKAELEKLRKEEDSLATGDSQKKIVLKKRME